MASPPPNNKKPSEVLPSPEAVDFAIGEHRRDRTYHDDRIIELEKLKVSLKDAKTLDQVKQEVLAKQKKAPETQAKVTARPIATPTSTAPQKPEVTDPLEKIRKEVLARKVTTEAKK